ncbi:hypothetical protein JOD45_001923 [Scopulibacillus daqui]|uniref:Spo0E like sporulation regulatory protein n=1 Tax=Scopulibacillus daqui TaxID=1469162 RepID=A0ABS2Q080_9BACL|nr:aspartyl-phosphate phosphatase Spo0E family protein [Scopulibacillus daqui]MBM7645704.1 hypothetical protein [Scopulibacillus daqui]
MTNNEIEKKRIQLIETANQHGFTSTKTLLCSQELDRLLIKYQHQQKTNAPRRKIQPM